MSPPLTGREFLSNWNGLTLGDLVERTRTTSGDLPSFLPARDALWCAPVFSEHQLNL